MVNKTVLEVLDQKITLMVEKYEALKEENKILNETIISNRETEARLRQEILKLKEEDELKDLELEEIAERIGQSIGIVQPVKYAS